MFDSSLFIGQSYFNNDRAQLYLIPKRLHYTLKRLCDTEKVISWKSKDLPVKEIITSTTTDNSLCPLIRWHENSIFFQHLKEPT